MMPESKPKQEKGVDPRILLYVGSDKEKLLKQQNCGVKKINTYHYIAFYMQKQKKEETAKEQICNQNMTTLTLLHLWVDTLSLHTLVPLILVNGNVMPTIVIQW
jgi:hypothetical protein